MSNFSIVLNKVSMVSAIKTSDILSNAQPTKDIANARHALFYIAKMDVTLSPYRLAKLSGKAPASVRHSIKTAHNLLQVDAEFRQLIFDINTEVIKALNQPTKATT